MYSLWRCRDGIIKPVLTDVTGESMKWKEGCRIKHLPSRMYLTVLKESDDEFKVNSKMIIRVYYNY